MYHALHIDVHAYTVVSMLSDKQIEIEHFSFFGESYTFPSHGVILSSILHSIGNNFNPLTCISQSVF